MAPSAERRTRPEWFPSLSARRLMVFLLLSLPASSTTYTWLGDDDLLARSPLVVCGRVLSQRPVTDASGLTNTLVTLEVLEALKGSASARIEVLLPGGEDGDHGSLVTGVPALQQGEEAVLFLGPRPDGLWILSELGLSKFDILADDDGNLWALRAMFLSGKLELAAPPGRRAEAEAARPLATFLSWIRGAGPAPAPGSPAGPLVPRPGQSSPQWAQSSTDIYLRWPWDQGAATPTIRYQPATGQTLLSDGSNGIARMTNGLNSWKAVSRTDIRTGEPAAGTGGTIQVNLDDLTGGAPPYASPWWTTALCGGGVLGVSAASWLGSHTHGGLSYHTVKAGYVFMRKYSCSMSAIAFETVVAHELGHVLGLGHPDLAISTKDPDQVQFSANHCLASMRSCVGAYCPGGCAAYDNLRDPFSLGEDDEIAVRYLYPATVSPITVTAISPDSGSTAGGTAVALTGTGFQAGASVAFGDAVVVPTSFVNATTLTATAPAHATGPVSVVVTNPDSGFATLTNGYFFVPPSVAAGFYPLTPCRLFDTRSSAGADAASPALVANAVRTFAIAGRCGVPAQATTLSLNLTVTGPGAAGELVLFPGNGVRPFPPTSSISFKAGETRANNGLVLLSTDGTQTIGVFNNSSGAVHLILDVNGTFR